MGCQGQRGRGVNKETESPRASSVVSGQWVAGASFLGWEEGRGQRPRKGRAGSSGSLERWPLSHRDTSSREQAFTSPPSPAVPYKSHLLVRAADQRAGAVLWGLGR